MQPRRPAGGGLAAADPPEPGARFQDLARFRVPPGFRGKSALVVQLWWIVQALLFHPSPQVCFGCSGRVSAAAC